MTDKQSRAHHTVPRFYLERFADDKRQVMRVALPGEQRHRLSVRNASVVNDFYTVELVDGSASDEYEKVFSQVEGAAAPAFRAVLDDAVWPLAANQKIAIAWWAALQAVRTPAARQGSDDVLNLMAGLEVGTGGKAVLRRRMEEDFGRLVGDEELDATWCLYTRPEGPGFKTHPNRHIIRS